MSTYEKKMDKILRELCYKHFKSRKIVEYTEFKNKILEQNSSRSLLNSFVKFLLTHSGYTVITGKPWLQLFKNGTNCGRIKFEYNYNYIHGRYRATVAKLIFISINEYNHISLETMYNQSYHIRALKLKPIDYNFINYVLQNYSLLDILIQYVKNNREKFIIKNLCRDLRQYFI